MQRAADAAYARAQQLRDQYGPPADHPWSQHQSHTYETAWRAARALDRDAYTAVTAYAQAHGAARQDTETRVKKAAEPPRVGARRISRPPSPKAAHSPHTSGAARPQAGSPLRLRMVRPVFIGASPQRNFGGAQVEVGIKGVRASRGRVRMPRHPLRGTAVTSTKGGGAPAEQVLEEGNQRSVARDDAGALARAAGSRRARLWETPPSEGRPGVVSDGEEQAGAEENCHGDGEAEPEGDGPGAAVTQHDEGVAERRQGDYLHEAGFGASGGKSAEMPKTASRTPLTVR